MDRSTTDNQTPDAPEALSIADARALSERFRDRMRRDVDSALTKFLPEGETPEPELRSALFHYAYFRRHARKKASVNQLVEALDIASRQDDPVATLQDMAAKLPRAFPWGETRGHMRQAGGKHGKRHSHMFRDGEWRRYYPLPQVTESDYDNTFHAVRHWLEQNGYSQIDYQAGTCVDDRKNTRKIGRLLPESLKDRFARDLNRQGDNLMIVISRHPWDLIRMSTQRGWESCLARDGMYREYIPREVKAGSMVAYLVSKNDPEILDPMGRIGIKPYWNDKGDTLMMAADIYGMGPKRFQTAVQKVLDTEYNFGRYGTFKLDDDQVYDDGMELTIRRIPDGHQDWDAARWIDYLGLKVEQRDGQDWLIGDIDLRKMDLAKLPDFSAYHLQGDLVADGNALTSVKGLPSKVHGMVNLSNNQIASLEGSPQMVSGDFVVSANRLTSTRGLPADLQGGLDLSDNRIEQLEGMPKRIRGNLFLLCNQLTDLTGMPETVTGDCCVNNNALMTLEGDLALVRGDLEVGGNPSLLDLRGMPRVEGRSFNAAYCGLTTLDGMDPKFNGAVRLSHNRLTSLEGLGKYLRGGIDADNNEISTLAGLPRRIQGNLRLSFNKLTSTKGLSACTDIDALMLDNNQLTELEDMPETLGHRLSLANNQLTSTRGLPRIIRGPLDLNANAITDASDLPDEVIHRITLFRNPVRHMGRKMPENCNYIRTDEGTVRRLPDQQFPPPPSDPATKAAP